MGTLHFLPNGSTLPPRMVPCRSEMLDLECYGAALNMSALADYEPCGATVTLRCPQCAVHRCEACALPDLRCPMCLTLNPRRYALQGAQ